MSLFAVFHVRTLDGDGITETSEFVEFYEDLDAARDSASRTVRAKGGRAEVDCNGHTVEVIY